MEHGQAKEHISEIRRQFDRPKENFYNDSKLLQRNSDAWSVLGESFDKINASISCLTEFIDDDGFIEGMREIYNLQIRILLNEIDNRDLVIFARSMPENRFGKNIESHLYVVKLDKQIKVGISGQPRQRIKILERERNSEAEKIYISDQKLKSMPVVEKELLKKFKEFRCGKNSEWLRALDWDRVVDAAKIMVQAKSFYEKNKLEGNQ